MKFQEDDFEGYLKQAEEDDLRVSEWKNWV